MNTDVKNSILIVDDENLNLEILVKILRSEYTIYLTKQGSTAIELANKHLPDLILLDIVMPEIDGFEVLKVLKSSEKTKNIPVIFITGLDSVEYEEKGLTLDAADFIYKPFSPEIVKLRIKNQIQIVNQIRAIEEYGYNLEAAVKASEEANKAKSTFLARMSHEIRTPLNAVIGIAEIQLQNEAHLHDVKEAFTRIHTSGNLLLGIINDILDMSKIEAGKLEITPARYDVPDMINDTVYLNMIKYEHKPIEFILNVDEKIPASLVGDELRIKQILNNLLSNAFKYTEAGEVELSLNMEKYTDNTSSESVILVFNVRDSGQGMSSEQVEKLFEEYYRFNHETNRTTEGIGLGMGITQNLIHLMNGEILVKSEPEKGSLFTVRLPQGKTGAPELGKEAVEKLRSFRHNLEIKTSKVHIVREPIPFGKVLVVDDIEMNLYVAKEMLSPYLLQIDMASSGHEAIEKIKSSFTCGSAYDLVFMDHMMPVMDGIKTTGKIRELGHEFEKLPIIALTANAISGVKEMFLANGFDGFLSKPIAMQELDIVIKEWLSPKKTTPDGELKPEEIAVDEENSGFWDNIGTISEINTKIGLSWVAGGKDVYRNTLDMFYKKIRSESQKLTESLDAKDLRNFTISIHAMKSMLAVIGAVPLSETALDLETASNNKDIDRCVQQFPEFKNKLMSLHEKLSLVFSGAKIIQETPAPVEEKIKPAKVLIVDNTEMILLVVKDKLLGYGFHVDTAESGLEAIEKIKSRHAGSDAYDLVFMDYMMPEMNGMETTSRIRKWETKENIKSNVIVALTADKGSCVKEVFLNNGFDGFLSKPVATKELENIFKELLPEVSLFRK